MDDKAALLDPALEKQLKGHRGAITALYYSPNELQVASGSLDNSVLLWDLGGMMRSYRFRGHDEAVMDVTFSSTGKYMASASRDKTVRLWIPTVTGSTGVFKAHSQTVRSVQFNHDSSKILTASDDKIVKIWSSEKYKFISSFVGHTNWVRCARMASDGSVIASCSDDKSTRLWNPSSGEMIHMYKDQKGHGMNLAWHPSGCYVAVGTSQGNIKLYDIRAHNLVQYYSIHNDEITQVAFHPSGSYILTASKDGQMKILDLLEGHPIFTLTGHIGPVNAVNFSPSGESFASAGDDKLVNLWKTNFTELASDVKENVGQNSPHVAKSTQSSKPSSAAKGKPQGPRVWYLCYHSSKYPVVTFSHLDDVTEECHRSACPNRGSGRVSGSPRRHSVPWSPSERPQTVEPIANSTLIESPELSNISSDTTITRHRDDSADVSNLNSSPRKSTPCPCDLNGLGHSSHIPRSCPPKPTKYSIPHILNKEETCCDHKEEEEDLFGMVKLKQNDVCYTSGTIEWVGRKRSFPINTGFKVIDDVQGSNTEPCGVKKLKKDKSFRDKTYTVLGDELRECNCADMLPTVNAIVDHLNALHEAVDLVDLRLDALEDIITKEN